MAKLLKRKKKKDFATEKRQAAGLARAIEYTKALKNFARDIQQDNPGLSHREAIRIANDELSGAYEKRIKRKKLSRRLT